MMSLQRGAVVDAEHAGEPVGVIFVRGAVRGRVIAVPVTNEIGTLDPNWSPREPA